MNGDASALLSRRFPRQCTSSLSLIFRPVCLSPASSKSLGLSLSLSLSRARILRLCHKLPLLIGLIRSSAFPKVVVFRTRRLVHTFELSSKNSISSLHTTFPNVSQKKRLKASRAVAESIIFKTRTNCLTRCKCHLDTRS